MSRSPALEPVGKHRRVRPGDGFYREGDGNCDFFVILEGKVAVVEVVGSRRASDRLFTDLGGFLGELGLVTGQAVFVSAVVREPGQALRGPAGAAAGKIVTQRSGARRSDPAGPDHAPRDPDSGWGSAFGSSARATRPTRVACATSRSRNRPPHHWVDLEVDHPGAEETPRHWCFRARGVSDRAPRLRSRAAQPERTRSSPARWACGRPSAIGGDVRSDRRRGRPRWPGGRAVRRIGRARDGRAGSRRDRRQVERRRGSRTTSASRQGSRARSWRSARRSRRRSSESGSTSPARPVGLESLDGTFRVHLRDGESVIAARGRGRDWRSLPQARSVADLAKFEGRASTTLPRRSRRSCAGAIRSWPVGGGNSAGQAALLLSRYVPPSQPRRSRAGPQGRHVG